MGGPVIWRGRTTAVGGGRRGAAVQPPPLSLSSLDQDLEFEIGHGHVLFNLL